MTRESGFFLLFIFSSLLSAQDGANAPHSRTSNKNITPFGTPIEVRFSSQFEIDANGLNNNFINALMQGKFLDDELKQEALAGLNDINRLEFNIKLALELRSIKRVYLAYL